MDQELLEAGVEVIRELSEARNLNLPNSVYKTVATQMLKHDKLGDNDWCNKKLVSEQQIIKEKLDYAKKKKFYPFVNVGFGACLWIRKNYGDWTLEIMSKKLKNPIDAYTNWAIRFAATMVAVGARECEMSDDLYSLITNHPSWKEMNNETRAWIKHLKSFKKKRLH